MTDLPRVLSYPPVHDYVDRLHGTAATLVHRDQPWPRLPDLYEPAWLSAHASDWDVAHFHFTWEQYPPATFRAVLDAHRSAGTPIVWTAHDLRNPHVRDGAGDDAYLALLAEAADEVLTLTPGAAAEVTERFGRSPRVVPHGPVVPPAEAAALRRPRRAAGAPLRLLLLAKSLRANLDWRTPLEVVRDLAATRTDAVPVQLDVHLHPDAPARAEIEGSAAPDAITVTVAPRLDTTGLRRRVAEADALLLPYRWGSHSGLLELAADLGTQPVVTDVGFLAQQAPCHVVGVRDGRVDADRLRSLLERMAAGTSALDPVPIHHRERVLAEFEGAHARLYARSASSTGTAVGR